MKDTETWNGFPGGGLTRQEEAELFMRIRGADPGEAAQARDRVVLANVGLAHSIARRHASIPGIGLSAEDMAHEGILGLLIAVDRFDPSRGTKFSTFATWWVANKIYAAIDDTGFVVRIPRGEVRRRRVANQPVHGQAIVADLASLPARECGAFTPEDRESVAQALANLSAEERAAVLARHLHGQTNGQTGQALGIGKRMVEKLISRAILGIREQLGLQEKVRDEKRRLRQGKKGRAKGVPANEHRPPGASHGLRPA